MIVTSVSSLAFAMSSLQLLRRSDSAFWCSCRLVEEDWAREASCSDWRASLRDQREREGADMGDGAEVEEVEDEDREGA